MLRKNNKKLLRISLDFWCHKKKKNKENKNIGSFVIIEML